MPNSLGPDVIDALIRVANDEVDPSVIVLDGMGVTDNPSTYLMVGVDDPTTSGVPRSFEEKQDHATVGISGIRDVAGVVFLSVAAWRGDGDQRMARDETRDVIDALFAGCRANPSLSVTGLLWVSAGTEFDLKQWQHAEGCTALATFQVAYSGQI